MRKYSQWYHVDILAYALMEWHVHLFVFDHDGKLPFFMNCVHGQYAQYFNRVTGRIGHVFGERYNNKIVQSDPYGMWLSRYIHRQPVEAGLTGDPQEYKWSSYRQYIGLEPRDVIKPHVVLEQFGKGKSAQRHYRKFVETDNEGPVDWEDRLLGIVGDRNFIAIQEETMRQDTRRAVDPDDALRHLAEKLGIKMEVLQRPCGKKERKVRHQVFRILFEENGLSCSGIAQLCRVSVSAVAKVIRNER